MDFNGLYWFVKVVELGSMSKAARYGGCAVSTVSARIAQLEQQLGVRLMERTTRKIRLTDAGEVFYERARQSVQSAEAAQLAVEELHQTPSGLLTVTVPPEIMTSRLQQQLQSLHAAYPALRLRLLLTTERKDLLAENIDVAIRVGALDDSQMVARKLTELTLSVVASTTFMKDFAGLKHPSDLAGVPCIPIIDSNGKTHPWVFCHADKTEPVVPTGYIEVNTFSAGILLAKQHQGVALNPQWGPAGNENDLVTLLPDWTLPRIPVWAIFPSKTHLPPKVRVFIDFMLAVFDSPER